VASAVGAKGGALADSFGGGATGGALANGVIGGASAIANAAARSLIDGSDFGDNVMAALPDVIGQTVVGVIAGRIQDNDNAAREAKLRADADPYNPRFDGKTADEIAAMRFDDYLNAGGAGYRRGIDSSPEFAQAMKEASEIEGRGIFAAKAAGISGSDGEGLSSLLSGDVTVDNGGRLITGERSLGDQVAGGLMDIQKAYNNLPSDIRQDLDLGLAALHGGPIGVVGTYALNCPSSNDLRQRGRFPNGGFCSSGGGV
jgi:hypothetical protein